MSMPRQKKLAALPPDQTGPVERRDYVTAIFGPDGQRLTTIPLPEKGCDRDAPWGRDENGRVIAPFGIGFNGKPRRRMPGGKLTGGVSQFKAPTTEAIGERLAALDCHPITNLAEIALKQSVDPFVRIKAAAERANYYCYAKRRTKTAERRENLVAGEGFEPPTKGL